MSKEILTFGNMEIKKKVNFTAIKVLFFTKYEDIREVLLSNKIYFG